MSIINIISSLKQSLDEDESGQILLFHPRFSGSHFPSQNATKLGAPHVRMLDLEDHPI